MEWAEHLAPVHPAYRHHQTGEDNGDAHLKNLRLASPGALLHEKSYPRVGFPLFSLCMTQVSDIVRRSCAYAFIARVKSVLGRDTGTISREAP